VLKIYCGDHKVGDKAQMEMYDADQYLGERWIFSDPTSGPPAFEVLPPEFEDEVLFLLQKDPAVQDLKEAVRRVQGVSVAAQEASRDYIREHHGQAVEPLLAELRTLGEAVFSEKEVFYGSYRMRKLAEALLLEPSPQGEEYVLDAIRSWETLRPSKIDWDKAPRVPSARGEFLKDLFASIPQDSALRGKARNALRGVFPRLKGGSVPEMVQALLLSGLETPDSLLLIRDETQDADLLALGLYQAGNVKDGGWQWKAAAAYWRKASALASKLQLKHAIEEELADLPGRPER
jgi:hypothetical protein